MQPNLFIDEQRLREQVRQKSARQLLSDTPISARALADVSHETSLSYRRGIVIGRLFWRLRRLTLSRFS